MALIILAPWRMMPCFSTALPIMKPGTSLRNTSGMPKASQRVMKRVALSALSTKSTPPFTRGWLARMPTGLPFSRARPVMISPAKSFFTSRKLPSSTSPSMKSFIWKGAIMSVGTRAVRSFALADTGLGSATGTASSQCCGK